MLNTYMHHTVDPHVGFTAVIARVMAQTAKAEEHHDTVVMEQEKRIRAEKESSMKSSFLSTMSQCVLLHALLPLCSCTISPALQML